MYSAHAPSCRLFSIFTSKVMLVIAFGSFCVHSNAQGCGQRPGFDFDWRCQSTGHECYDQVCVDGGKDSDYCSQGYGTCCDTDINTANVTCDIDECCEGAGDCSGGCAPIRAGVPRRTVLLQERLIGRSVPRTSCDQPIKFQNATARVPALALVSDRFITPNGMLLAPVDASGGKSLAASSKAESMKNVQTQFRGPIFNRVTCDAQGNVYARQFQARTKGRESVQEIARTGELVRLFKVEDAGLDLSVGDFAIGPDNHVYMLGWSMEHVHPGSRAYVAQFTEDGSLTSTTQLTSEEFFPASLAVFKTGEFLVTGRQGKTDNTPFTAVFAATGKLIGKIYEPEDDELRKRAESGDLHDGNVYGNTAVGLGRAVAGSDGNVYLMRRTSPALIYVISPKGNVVRKFRIDPASSAMLPDEMQASKDRLAISFEAADGSRLIKVVDLTGNGLAEYPIDATAGSAALACYDPPVLTFMKVDGDDVHGNMFIQDLREK